MMALSLIERIGYLAAKTLQDTASGQVIGVTSRGLFLLMDGERLVFLSTETKLSPLTAKIEPIGCDWQSVKNLSGVTIRGKIIRIGEVMEFSLEGSTVWQPPLPARDIIIPPGVNHRLTQVARYLIEAKGGGGWVDYLGYFVGLQSYRITEEMQRIEGLVAKMRIAMLSQNALQVRQAIQPFMGLGRGLTPSGDDFLIGLLLATKRWHGVVKLDLVLQEVGEWMVSEAASRTNRISAAMIACAAQGYADERLLDALDGIVLGNVPAQECAAWLADYGGSSGVDALLGMAVGMMG